MFVPLRVAHAVIGLPPYAGGGTGTTRRHRVDWRCGQEPRRRDRTRSRSVTRLHPAVTRLMVRTGGKLSADLVSRRRGFRVRFDLNSGHIAASRQVSRRARKRLMHCNMQMKRPPRSGFVEIQSRVLIKGGASSRLVILASADTHKTHRLVQAAECGAIFCDASAG